MTAPAGGDPASRSAETDLEYDLAHEAASSALHWQHADPAVAVDAVYVATRTAEDDDGGDYGYDLAHDVPK